MAKLVFSLNDGTRLETDIRGPYSVREQVDWEEHFGQSFFAVQQATAEMVQAGAEKRPVDPKHAFRQTWIMWFGWHRLRPQVPSRFDVFLKQLADWNFEPEPGDETDDDDSGGIDDPAPAGQDGRLDPTATEATSTSTP